MVVSFSIFDRDSSLNRLIYMLERISECKKRGCWGDVYTYYIGRIIL